MMTAPHNASPLSVFQKFGGIRPMAAKLGVPSSTIKSWHSKGAIPAWRRQSVMDAAARLNIDLSVGEVAQVRPDAASIEQKEAA